MFFSGGESDKVAGLSNKKKKKNKKSKNKNDEKNEEMKITPTENNALIGIDND